MAFTASTLVNTVMGDLRVKIMNVSCDSTAGSIDAGMGNLIAVHAGIKSMASFVNSGSTRHIAVISPNAGTTGTTIVGTVGMTGCVSGDVYTLVCYAKS
jgi:hypothetical protein